MNILMIDADKPHEHNCAQWRVYVPYRALRAAGVPVRVIDDRSWVNRTPEAVKLTEWADIVFFMRNMFFAEPLATAAYWRAKGKPIVVDLDDGYAQMTESTGSPSWNFWQNGLMKDANGKDMRIYPIPLIWLQWGIKLVGAVSSPSLVIVDDWKAWAHSYWIPNYYDPALYLRHDNYKEPGSLYLGWGGSATHLASWFEGDGLGGGMAIKRLMKENPKLMLAIGGDPRVHKGLTERTAEGKKWNIPPARKLALGWKPHAMWSDSLSIFDIGIIPLSGEYDRRRSFIKTLEFTLMSIPWVGTNTDPNWIIKSSSGILVENDENHWYLALTEMIKNYPDYLAEAKKNMAQIGRAHV